jgi:serine/threonine-protein kinase
VDDVIAPGRPMSRLVLPPDVVIVPAGDLPLEARRLLPSIEGRHCVSRAGVRAPSCLIDDAGVALLTHFRRPNSIVEAIVAFSAATGRDPFGALEDAYPLFTRLSDAGLLVATDSPLASPIVPTLGPGATLGAWTVERCVHVVEDVEVYRARHGAGDLAAIKLLRHRRDAHVAAALAGEGSFLERLDGTATPRLLARGTDAGRPWLAIEWCGDATVVDAAAPLRLDPRPEARARLLAIARDAARALGGLHARGVLHGDVHERNFLVDDAGRVRVIDLGLARRIGDAGEGAASMVMASVAPELARARLAYIPPPPTLASEQYAVAALAWQVVAGCAHVEPPLGVDEALRHVAALPRSSFAERGAPPWPAVERVLRVALDPEPARRWPSLGAFARALDEVVEFERTRARRAVRATTHGGAPHRLL